MKVLFVAVVVAVFSMSVTVADAQMNMRRVRAIAIAKTTYKCQHPANPVVGCAGVIRPALCFRWTRYATCSTYYAQYLKGSKYVRQCTGFFLIKVINGRYRTAITSYKCEKWERIGG